MKICFFLLLIAFVISCQSQTASRDIVYNGERTTINNNNIKSQEKTNDDEEVISTTTLKCGNKDFNLVALYKNGSKSVNITEGNTIRETIKLPSQSDVNGFSLNWARETKEGFEISIEYGSRYYYQKNFSFVCEQNNFYLSKVKVESFDKADPEKLKTKDIEINPKLPIERFLITNFIGND